MIRIASLLLLAATPALAEGPTPTETAAIVICVPDGPVDARIEVLKDTGWMPVDEADLPTAAAPLVAGQALSFQTMNSNLNLADILRVIADPDTTVPAPGVSWFADAELPGGAILRLTAIGGIVICDLALSQPVPAEDLAAAIGHSVSRTDTLSGGTVVWFRNGEDPFAIAMLLADPAALAAAGADPGAALVSLKSSGE